MQDELLCGGLQAASDICDTFGLQNIDYSDSNFCDSIGLLSCFKCYMFKGSLRSHNFSSWHYCCAKDCLHSICPQAFSPACQIDPNLDMALNDEPPFGPVVNGTMVVVFWDYRPSDVAAYVFMSLFAVATLGHVFLLFRLRAWPFMPLLLGGLCKSSLLATTMPPETQSS
jgi:hypothetical protein